jgi:hypothetical protein
MEQSGAAMSQRANPDPVIELQLTFEADGDAKTKAMQSRQGAKNRAGKMLLEPGHNLPFPFRHSRWGFVAQILVILLSPRYRREKVAGRRGS